MSVINVMGSIKRAVPQGSGHHEILPEGAILIQSLKDVNIPKIAFEDEVCKFDFLFVAIRPIDVTALLLTPL